MSVLAWLFGLGALAVAFPLVFHLIRRTPKGRVEFSSLMFLRPSPPRLTRRSRLDNVLLLLLRMIALVLIAAAFMRPYLRSGVDLGLGETSVRKTAILLDSSASMRRGDLWDLAIERVEKLRSNVSTRHEFAVYRFDERLKRVVPFATEGNRGSVENATAQLKEEPPSWRRSDLGQALVELAEELESAADEIPDAVLQIVVVTDQQIGSETSQLENYTWPSRIKVSFERIAGGEQLSSNASLELLPDESDDLDAAPELVMVRNAADSENESFEVAWVGHDGARGASVPFYVPPGTSRILTVPRPDDASQFERLELSGDGASFDNRFFAVPPNQRTIRVAYLGNESSEDADGMLYYFQRSQFETPRRKVEIDQFAERSFELGSPQANDTLVNGAVNEKPNDLPSPAAAAEGRRVSSLPASQTKNVPDLVIVTRSIRDDESQAVGQAVALGANLFVVMNDLDMVGSTNQWTGIVPGTARIRESREYAMLGQIDFEHPIFEPFARPRVNDFTQIRFWKHVNVELQDGALVMARFDDGAPALWQVSQRSESNEAGIPVEKKQNKGNTSTKEGDNFGVVMVMATGWAPSSSQLALSEKFLPMMNRIVNLSAEQPQVEHAMQIGGALALPAAYAGAIAESQDRQFTLDAGRPAGEQLDAPGVYRLSSSQDNGTIRVAVNVDPAESLTDIMPLERLATLGVTLGAHQGVEAEKMAKRKLRDQELEQRQRLWKWLIVAAIGFIIVETWLAGRTDRMVARYEQGEFDAQASMPS